MAKKCNGDSHVFPFIGGDVLDKIRVRCQCGTVAYDGDGEDGWQFEDVDDDLTEQFEDDHAVLQRLEKYYAGMSLSNKKRTAKVFDYRGKKYVCTGAMGSGKTGTEKVWLNEVIPADMYVGRDYLPNSQRYAGLQFMDKGKCWKITNRILEVYSVRYVKARQEKLFMMEAENASV